MLIVPSLFRWIAFLSVIAAIGFLSCCNSDKSEGNQILKYTFCFEHDFEGWIPRGIDLDQPPVDWKITLTDEMAKCGNKCVKLHLDNVNDKAKIWIEREFGAKPNCDYAVAVRFYFATADVGEVNLWRIIAGARNRSPETGDDLPYRDNTGKQSNLPQPEWTTRIYSDTLTTCEDGLVYLMIGIWGTHEVTRNYLIDSIVVTLDQLNER